MDLYGGTLDVIAEEMTVSDDEDQAEDRSKAFMDMYSIENGAPVHAASEAQAPQVSSFQRFSVGTNESLHFEPYIPEEDETGHALGSDDVFLTGNQSAFDESKELMEGCTAQSERDPPDAYCADCQTSTYAFQKLSGSHKNHRVILMKKAAQEIKVSAVSAVFSSPNTYFILCNLYNEMLFYLNRVTLIKQGASWKKRFHKWRILPATLRRYL